MSNRKILNDAGVACGCEVGLDRHGRETYTSECIQHKKEFDMRHAAADQDAAARRAQFINLDLIS